PVTITSGPQTGMVTEIADHAPGENINDHTQGGSITFTDPDLSDTHTAVATAEGSGYLGTFSLDKTAIDTTHTVGWSFSVNDSALDYLQGGEHLVQKYDVKIDDGHGGSKTETVTVDIYGSNDAAVFTGDDSGSVTEDDAPEQTGGTLHVADADH